MVKKVMRAVAVDNAAAGGLPFGRYDKGWNYLTHHVVSRFCLNLDGVRVTGKLLISGYARC